MESPVCKTDFKKLCYSIERFNIPLYYLDDQHTTKGTEVYKTPGTSFSEDTEIMRHAPVPDNRKRYMMDVGDDPELEQILDQTRVPDEMFARHSFSDADNSM